MVSQLLKAAAVTVLPLLVGIAKAQNTPLEGSAYFVPEDLDPLVDNAIGCLDEQGRFEPSLTDCAHFTRDSSTLSMSSPLGTCSYQDASQPQLDRYNALICGTGATPATFYNVGDMICSMGTQKCWQDLEEKGDGMVWLFRYGDVTGGRVRTFMMFQ